jgi:hypothetical protein
MVATGGVSATVITADTPSGTTDKNWKSANLPFGRGSRFAEDEMQIGFVFAKTLSSDPKPILASFCTFPIPRLATPGSKGPMSCVASI